MPGSKIFAVLFLSYMLLSPSSAEDWTSLGDPKADPGPDHRWELDPDLSDSFSYQNKLDPNFTSRWHDTNQRGWKGPGATLFNSDNVFLSDGKLVILGSRVPEEQLGEPHCKPCNKRNCENCFYTRRTVHTGYVASKKNLTHPVFTECSMKISGTPLSSNFWLKSDETEIDVNESYGDGCNRSRAKSNVHFFKRNGTAPDSVNNQYLHPTSADLSAKFHRYGVHWISETFLRFYFDGMEIRFMEKGSTNSTESLIDPSGLYLNEDMWMVLDLEAHRWRKEDGVPSDEELADDELNRMEVDWVRTYHPVAA